ncbi:cyclic nucleotide-binding domain-containing protein [Pedobacter cryotolerans]|uniref:Crp/Fnr family transcriptional regulator n=1 Tax=Pedobacter cryotolerans TaxID=2571270 RepID=A0A4U1CDU2_9SPHI|nr:hypothetical protein [Pedobacter cryotolerans]TKC03477.1 hypothetical protein FA045_02595 [Pedobacter cryotolerans]
MNPHSTISTLQLTLQTYGALQPLAWQKINQLKQEQILKIHQSFIRKEGSIAYLANGALKEYDAQYRKSPSIINFISANQCLVTRKYNQSLYLKACMPCTIYFWDFEDLQSLYQEFKELKKIYDSLCANYDAAIAFRLFVLENSSTAQRIELFRQNFKALLPFLKKKDIANYLQLNYTHFLHINNKIP